MMKKILSLLLIVSLVVSLAAVLGACGKKNEPNAAESTADVSAEVSGEKEDMQAAFEEMYSDLYDDDYSYTEHTTDEHYEDDYKALTLPAPTKPVKQSGGNGTAPTAAPMRETTTKNRMFENGKAVSTTAKSGTGTGTTKPAGTNAAQQTSMSDTTIMADPIPETNVAFGGNVEVPEAMPRPNDTYLDKYVVDVLAGGSYTAKTEMKSEGMAMPITYYADGSNSAVKMSISGMLASSMDMPAAFSSLGEIRMITKDGKAYLAWTGGYMQIEGEDMEGITEMLEEARNGQDIRSMLQIDRLQYCGVTNGNGYVCETYRVPDENMAYCFYFTSQGLTRWEVIDTSTNQVMETMVIALTKGIADKDAFKVSGKKYTMEEVEKMFGGAV